MANWEKRAYGEKLFVWYQGEAKQLLSDVVLRTVVSRVWRAARWQRLQYHLMTWFLDMGRKSPNRCHEDPQEEKWRSHLVVVNENNGDHAALHCDETA